MKLIAKGKASSTLVWEKQRVCKGTYAHQGEGLGCGAKLLVHETDLRPVDGPGFYCEWTCPECHMFNQSHVPSHVHRRAASKYVAREPAAPTAVMAPEPREIDHEEGNRG